MTQIILIAIVAKEAVIIMVRTLLAAIAQKFNETIK